MSDSLQPPWLQHTRLPCPPLSLGICSNSCPLSPWCHPTISSSVTPFSSCSQSFTASMSFSMSWLFTSGGQSIGASVSASVLPVNIQGWFPLGLTSLISLLSKSLLQHHSLKASIFQCSAFFNGPTLTSMHNCWNCTIGNLFHSVSYLRKWSSFISFQSLLPISQ